MGKIKIMGVLNITPDSFYDGNQEILTDRKKIINKLNILKKSDIIDVGCESSRPGSTPINEDEEIERLSKLTDIINKDKLFSIDTYKYNVAKYALSNGFRMINDIYAGRYEKNKMFELASEFNVPIILMHMKGSPENMQKNTHYDSIIDSICSFFEERICTAKDYGISDSNIILDPGIGFGKNIDDNFTIIKNINKFKKIGYKVLIGLSKKTFLAYKGNSPNDRLSATIAMNTISIINGADIIRVHDSLEAVKMRDVLIKYNYSNS